MDESLRQAILGAGDIQAPASPLNAPSASEIASIYESAFQLPQATAATGALVNQASDVVAEQKRAASAAKSKSSYKRVAKEDGGFDFFDPQGNPIDANTYARAVGASVERVLADSQNPIDVGFLNDYKAFKDYFNAKQNSSSQSSREYAKKIEEDVKNNYGVDLAKMNAAEAAKQFTRAYPTVFGAHQENTFSSRFGGNRGRGVPLGRQFIPSYSAGDLNAVSGLTENYSLED